MNIFILSENPQEAAQMHCDKHTTKLCQECGKKNVKNKFCSQLCSNKYNGKKREQTNLSDNKKVKCEICNKRKDKNSFSYLIRGDCKSGRKLYCKRCGANDRERKRRERTWKDDTVLAMLNNSKQRAKNAGLEHTLVKEDIIIPDICPVLGIKLEISDRKTKYAAPSIDRIDNAKGYTKDNIVIVSLRANLLKRDATILELQALANFYKQFL